MMVIGMQWVCSIAHSTYPWGGHPLLCRAVARMWGVIRSKNFSSSSARCPRRLCGCCSASSMVARCMRVRSSAE